MKDCSELVVSVRSGNLEAFGALYDRFGRLVRAICYDRLRHQADADDLAQEIFLNAFRKLDQLQNPEKFGSWIVGIARRKAIDWQRRSAAKNNPTVEPFFDQHAKGSDESLDSKLDDLRQAIVQLPEREQMAIHIFYLAEQPASVAQDILELSSSGFYKLLERARTNVSNIMSSEEGIAR